MTLDKSVSNKSLFMVPCSLLVSLTHYSAKAHERHSEQAGGEEGDGRAFHCLRHFVHGQLLADAGEQHECESEADSGANGVPKPRP